MIIINTKNYKSGKELVKLVKLIETYDVHTIVAVPEAEISQIADNTVLNVYAQHVDFSKDKKSTGFVTASSVKSAGATGTILNHSEHRLNLDVLKKTIEQCKKAEIVTIVCAASAAEAQTIAQFRPSAIALEDPELISTGKSITSYNPREIKEFVKHLKGKPIVPICGAGISNIDDVKKAYEFGCKGVLIASAIAETKRPERFLEEIAQWRKQL